MTPSESKTATHRSSQLREKQSVSAAPGDDPDMAVFPGMKPPKSTKAKKKIVGEGDPCLLLYCFSRLLFAVALAL